MKRIIYLYLVRMHGRRCWRRMRVVRECCEVSVARRPAARPWQRSSFFVAKCLKFYIHHSHIPHTRLRRVRPSVCSPSPLSTPHSPRSVAASEGLNRCPPSHCMIVRETRASLDRGVQQCFGSPSGGRGRHHAQRRRTIETRASQIEAIRWGPHIDIKNRRRRRRGGRRGRQALDL